MSTISAINRARGQALIEFLVVALVLVPMFLLIPLLGKYLDMKQSAIAASRTLAFECTVRYEDCANLNANTSFADEIRRRFFSGNGTDVLTNDRPAQDVIGAGTGNALWVDRQGRPLLERYSDVGIVADAKTLNMGGSLVGTMSNNVGPGLFGLQLDRGMFDGRVQANVASQNGGSDFVSQLDSLGVKMQFHTAILTDAWTAKGPGSSGDLCNTASGSVIGRISPAMSGQCSAAVDVPLKVADVAYLPASAVVIPLAAMFESNVSSFNFHDFLDQPFVDLVPTSDPTAYPRLQ